TMLINSVKEALPKPPESFPFSKYEAELDKAQDEMGKVLKSFVAEGAVAASVLVSSTAYDKNGVGASLCVFHTLDDLVEDGLSAALDPFTNPRRITILKLLIPQGMTASEISKKTGLIGGQLYHHLSCLESADLIEKRGDTYHTKGYTQALLCGLSAAVGGMKIANTGDCSV
ncbi:MAG: winged helix-turn-helix domain-containing protein, partial [Defluviitaleaceae bacterium]|nr:winged helix-turn-helix domain-containing protein [Defluviitaleaceae bacterium]